LVNKDHFVTTSPFRNGSHLPTTQCACADFVDFATQRKKMAVAAAVKKIYSLHPKLHLCISIGSWDSSFLLPIWKVLSWQNEGFVSRFSLFYHYMMLQKLLKFAPMVIGCPFTSWWIVGKRSSFSYLGQNLKNYQQFLFCLFCAISQKGLFPLIFRFLFVICGKTVKSMILILAEIISVV
jgi:hypothetical protein